MPQWICEKGGQVNIIWWNWKKARENLFQNYLKISTTWQLLGYRGWHDCANLNPKHPARNHWYQPPKSVQGSPREEEWAQNEWITSSTVCSGQERQQLHCHRQCCYYQQIYSMGRCHLGNKARLLWTEPWKKTHDCKFNKSYKNFSHWAFKKIQTKHLSKSRETCSLLSLFNYHGTSVPGHSDCARSSFF